MLNEFTDEQLQAELARREEKVRLEAKPKQVKNPNLTKLIGNCHEYIDYLDQHPYPNPDMESYIFEAALEAFFGDDVWDWVNKQIR